VVTVSGGSGTAGGTAEVLGVGEPVAEGIVAGGRTGGFAPPLSLLRITTVPITAISRTAAAAAAIHSQRRSGGSSSG
jgi:hypothetical protein